MTLRRYYPAGAALGGYIYVLGGIVYKENEGSPTTAVNERYDPTTDSWTMRAPMPQPRAGMAVAPWGGHLHVFSGSDHWDYDPDADAWTIHSQPPISIGMAGSAAVVGRRIYIGVGTLLLDYDPDADTYTPRAAVPFANNYGEMLTSQGGKLYAMEGSSVAEYDPLRNAWTLRADVPTARSILSSGWNVQVGGRIYVVAGYASATESYDPSTNLWSTHAPMPWPGRDAAATTATCGRVYVIGGSTPGFSYTTNTVFHAPP
jgi:N-acetylneuraminic acid mutarotase